MGYSQEQGYTPASFNTLMDQVRQGVNARFGTQYTTESFLGTGFYKFFYPLVQRLQETDVKTSEIFLKLQDYIRTTNEKISKPVVTNPGLVNILAANGFLASVKKPVLADAGQVWIAVDTDENAADYPAKKLQINTIIKNSTVAGVVTQGTEVSTLVLTNGQSFDFAFSLPDRHETHLRLTITVSENNQNVIGNPDDVKALLLANIRERYQLGKNFEPQKYFDLDDAPWASQVLLEYSLDAGATYSTAVYNANFDDLLEVSLANTVLVEN